MKDDLNHPLLRWHRHLAQITGALALTYQKRATTKRSLLDWIERLEHVLKEMREMLDGKAED